MEIPIQYDHAGAHSSSFLTSSQVMLMLQAYGPFFEKERFG